MKALLPLFLLFGGSASAIPLIDIKKEDVCYEVASWVSTTKVVKGVMTTTMVARSLSTNNLSALKSIGIRPPVRDGCKYLLAGNIELREAGDTVSLTYVLDLGLFANMPPTVNAWVSRDLFIGSKPSEITARTNELVSKTIKLFVSDWKASHKAGR